MAHLKAAKGRVKAPLEGRHQLHAAVLGHLLRTHTSAAPPVPTHGVVVRTPNRRTTPREQRGICAWGDGDRHPSTTQQRQPLCFPGSPEVDLHHGKGSHKCTRDLIRRYLFLGGIIFGASTLHHCAVEMSPVAKFQELQTAVSTDVAAIN